MTQVQKNTNAGAGAQPAPDWQAIETFIDEYVQDYEMIGEDESGRAGYCTPNERERALILDAIHGLVADDAFVRLVRALPQTVAVPDVQPVAGDLRALVAYLRAEADFNRSWTDGRRGGDPTDQSPEYIARRLELAGRADGWADAVAVLISAPQPAAQAQPVSGADGVPRLEKDTRAALLYALWHHQGGSSPVGQPIRHMLGIKQHAYLTKEQYAEAHRVQDALGFRVEAQPSEQAAPARKMTFKIVDRPGAVAIADMRETFERSVSETAILAAKLNLTPAYANGSFSHYEDPDTDSIWTGFALGMRVSERLRDGGPDPLVEELSRIIRDMIVAEQAAWIEWRHGAGAEAAMSWIHNGLAGPGHIPDEDEPYGREPQAWYDANNSRPFPRCFCGRPSNILQTGKGFCSEAHYRQRQQDADTAPQSGGEATP
ncbi:hypothetical protein FOZ76_14640 [Verticiella sediminum]|uniref:Uncharacterized protein n=1 Tax=Verticiella sediminum TaxID=1247510 RepID=A0A556AID7_9BURK|nr:hypothetical protein [Verticiella sediminum]TSH92654.1 hypothetical protein FOZ76_14640 [Verticiella sediminum]